MGPKTQMELPATGSTRSRRRGSGASWRWRDRSATERSCWHCRCSAAGAAEATAPLAVGSRTAITPPNQSSHRRAILRPERGGGSNSFALRDSVGSTEVTSDQSAEAGAMPTSSTPGLGAIELQSHDRTSQTGGFWVFLGQAGERTRLPGSVQRCQDCRDRYGFARRPARSSTGLPGDSHSHCRRVVAPASDRLSISNRPPDLNDNRPALHRRSQTRGRRRRLDAPWAWQATATDANVDRPRPTLRPRRCRPGWRLESSTARPSVREAALSSVLAGIHVSDGSEPGKIARLLQFDKTPSIIRLVRCISQSFFGNSAADKRAPRSGRASRGCTLWMPASIRPV